jgi:putative peptidoglycan lipid II flippase
MRKLAQASLIVFGGYAASRVLGLVRNVVVLDQFGTSRDYEAFVAAILVPDLVFQVLAGGAVAAAFIPVFKSYWIDDEHEAWQVASSAINLAVLATGAVALVLSFFARPLSEVLVPGWDAPSKDLTAGLMRTLLVSPVIFAASAFASSMLNAFHRFALAALAPLVYNLSIIAGALLLRESQGIHSLAIGAVAGAALHLLVQVPGLLQIGFRYRLVATLAHPGVRSVLRLMAPRMVGLGVTHANLLVNVVLASFLVDGSVGYLNVAWLLLMSQVAFAMAISTAVFPTLAETSAANQREQMHQVFYLSLRGILFFTIPSAIGLMVLGEPLVRVFFEHGEFTAESTRQTAYALTFYALGLAGHGVIEIGDRVFYALQDTATPVLAACGAVGLNVVLSVLLMLTPLNFGGLALANSVAALAEATLLVLLLKRRVASLDLEELAASILRSLACGVLMGILILYLSRAAWGLRLPTSLLFEAFLIFGVASAGALFYLGLAAILRSDEVRVLRLMLQSR